MRFIGKLTTTLLAAALAGIAAVPASAGAPPAEPAELLPDLVQQPPDTLRLSGSGNAWRLGFGSTVSNEGAGAFRIDGHGGGGIDLPMTADQIISMDDGTTQTEPGVG